MSLPFFQTDGRERASERASVDVECRKKYVHFSLSLPLATALPLQQLPPRAEKKADCIAELSGELRGKRKRAEAREGIPFSRRKERSGQQLLFSGFTFLRS